MTPRERIKDAKRQAQLEWESQGRDIEHKYGVGNFLSGRGGKQLTDDIIDIMLDVIGDDDRDYSRDNADPESLAFLVGASTACNELRQQFRDSLTREKE